MVTAKYCYPGRYYPSLYNTVAYSGTTSMMISSGVIDQSLMDWSPYTTRIVEVLEICPDIGFNVIATSTVPPNYSDSNYSDSNYSDSNDGSPIIATGGDISIVGNYKLHTFRTSDNFTVISGYGPIDVLVVAGGGAGGTRTGGGGGAGGLIYTTQIIGIGNYFVSIGNGAPQPISNSRGGNGDNSAFNGLVAIGGGGGGMFIGNLCGKDGGSGGGSGYNGFCPGAGTPGQGYAGAPGSVADAGDGGGGAGEIGHIGIPIQDGGPGGDGGNGLYFSQFSTVGGNPAGWFAGGGGGAGGDGSPYIGGNGGKGGGGNGSDYVTSSQSAGSGLANTGGGGGGGWYAGYNSFGGGGGSGIVVIRYEIIPESSSSSSSVYPTDIALSALESGTLYVTGYAPNLTVQLSGYATEKSVPISAMIWDYSDPYNELDYQDYTVRYLPVSSSQWCKWTSLTYNVSGWHTFIMPGYYDVSLLPIIGALNPPTTFVSKCSGVKKDLVVCVKEILPIPLFETTILPGSIECSSTINFNTSATIPGSFPICKIGLDFGDNSDIVTISRMATTSYYNISAFSNDLNDPRNFIVTHDYIRYNTSIPATIYATLSVYACNTNSVSTISLPVVSLELPALSSIEGDLKLINSRSYGVDNNKILVFEGEKTKTIYNVMVSAVGI